MIRARAHAIDKEEKGEESGRSDAASVSPWDKFRTLSPRSRALLRKLARHWKRSSKKTAEKTTHLWVDAAERLVRDGTVVVAVCLRPCRRLLFSDDVETGVLNESCGSVQQAGGRHESFAVVGRWGCGGCWVSRPSRQAALLAAAVRFSVAFRPSAWFAGGAPRGSRVCAVRRWLAAASFEVAPAGSLFTWSLCLSFLSLLSDRSPRGDWHLRRSKGKTN